MLLSHLLSVWLLGSIPSPSLLHPVVDPSSPSAVRIVAHIKFCQLQTEAESREKLPKVCREEEIVPAYNSGEATSISDCLRGVMMFAAEFTYAGRLWRSEGGRCEEESSAFLEWRLKEAAKIKP